MTQNKKDRVKQKERLSAEGIFVRASTVVTGLKGISRRLVRVAIEGVPSVGEPSEEKGTIRADTLILPAGRLPEFVFVRSTDEAELEEGEISWETLETFRTFPGGKEGICTPPEPGRISDSSAVVKSLLSGRRLTRAIHRHLTGGAIPPVQNLVCEAEAILDVSEIHDVAPSERERPDILDVTGDSKHAWIFPSEYPGLDETSAQREAERCLKCGLICYRKQK